jgi:hypothetical protein
MREHHETPNQGSRSAGNDVASSPGTAPRTAEAAVQRRYPLLAAGAALILAVPFLYWLQLSAGRLSVPWYAPVMASAGAALVLFSLWARPGIGRGVVVLALCALAAFEALFVVSLSRNPEYTGPVRAGEKLPPFSATLAGGGVFTNANLEQGEPAFLVLFRGRW